MATRVLIIDDDRDTAEFLKLLVEPRGIWPELLRMLPRLARFSGRGGPKSY